MSVRSIFLLMTILLTHGCQSDDEAGAADDEGGTQAESRAMNEGPWPPRAPRTAPSDFDPQSHQFPQPVLVTNTGQTVPLSSVWRFGSDGWVEVYVDSTGRRGEYNQPADYALTFNSLDFELDFNVFEFPVHTNRFLETEFAVIYYNDERTGFRLVPETDDRYAFLEIVDTSGDEQELFLPLSSIIPGAIVRVGEQKFELRQDGWYSAGKKIIDVVSFQIP